MNSWVYGIGCSSLALASLVGLGGAGSYPSAAAPLQQEEARAPVLQQPGTQQPNTTLVTLATFARGSADASHDFHQTYEDIEIYRRLLTKALTPFVANNQASNSTLGTFFPNQNPYMRSYQEAYRATFATGTQNVHADLEHRPLQVEGVYLSSTGIVFTADVPGKLLLPDLTKPDTKPKQLTEWDRTRRELRGEKIEPAVKAPPQNSLNFVDSVLRSLAENGHNLSGLTPEQNVVVALTFRGYGMQQCQKCHTTVSAMSADNFFHIPAPVATNANETFFHGDLNSTAGQPSNSLPAQLSEGSQESQALRNYALQTSLPVQPQGQAKTVAQNDQAILGDLHFKQGRFAEASAAYSKSLKELSISGDDVWKMNPSLSDPQVRAVILKSIELQNRIIQCEAAMKHEEKVDQGVAVLKNWMSQLERMEKKAKDSKSSASGKANSGISAVPEKLIVIASKALLDRVGKHQITFEDFKAQVRVEYVKFDSSEK